MMHVVDAGPGDYLNGEHQVVLQCPKCQFSSDWITVKSVTEGRRGKPCPKCND